MSEIIQKTIADYFDTVNDTGGFRPDGKAVYVDHTDINFDRKPDNGVGPNVMTFITEIDWDKIDSKSRTVGDALTHSSFESGQLICQIRIQAGYGNKNERMHIKVADRIKKEFVQLQLPTSNNKYIRMGSCTTRPPFDEPKQGGKRWLRTDVIINYTYSEGYT